MSTTVASEPSSNSTPLQRSKATPLRLDYLDGLRGLAALYVVMHHSYYGLMAEVTLPRLLAHLTYWLYLGRSGVDIFIVLSGYCLMIPIARGSGYLPGGVWEFFKRRARRILPPYYAAIAVSLIGIALLHPLNMIRQSGTVWDGSLPVWNAGVIVSHLLLIHNFNPAWHSKIDYPMWSVATEWQIYFLFPLLLIPIWRRFGSVASVLIAFAVGLIPLALYFGVFSGVSSQFVGLFALGMAAADINFSKKPSVEQLRDKTPWGVLAIALTVGLVAISLLHENWLLFVALKDVIVGLATASLLVYCTRSLTRSHKAITDSHLHSDTVRSPMILRVLESKAVVGLGAFSYSLYLMHAPVLAVCLYYVRQTNLSPTKELALMMLIAVPLAVLCSYAFYLVFEHPFVQKRRPQAKQTLADVPPAEVNPQPAI